MIYHDVSWFIMIYHDISRYIMIYRCFGWSQWQMSLSRQFLSNKTPHIPPILLETQLRRLAQIHLCTLINRTKHCSIIEDIIYMFHLINYIWFYCKRKGNKKEIISKIMMKAEESLTDFHATEGAPLYPRNWIPEIPLGVYSHSSNNSNNSSRASEGTTGGGECARALLGI